MFKAFGVAVVTLALSAEQSDTIRFQALAVYVDTQAEPLSAYQFEISDPTGCTTIVGIEGGDHAAFSKPPYYDPKAIQSNRAIVAAYSTAEDLPNGKTRVATVHVQIRGDEAPQYALTLHVAASPTGKELAATISLSRGEKE